MLMVILDLYKPIENALCLLKNFETIEKEPKGVRKCSFALIQLYGLFVMIVPAVIECVYFLCVSF